MTALQPDQHTGQQTGQPPPDKDIPIARAVGRFFGHLWKAAAAPPGPDRDQPQTDAPTQRVRETSEQQPAELGGKPVILRRTTIEEIEFKDAAEK